MIHESQLHRIPDTPETELCREPHAIGPRSREDVTISETLVNTPQFERLRSLRGRV